MVSGNDRFNKINPEHKIQDFTKVKTKIDKLNAIFNELFHGINFINDEQGVIIPIKRGEAKYSINEMSDGEKSAIYYILFVLCMEENSYIIVDEPETYLNPNISSRL